MSKKGKIGVTSFITPNNLELEKEKFFDSKSYNPQFNYKWESKERLDKINKLIERPVNSKRKNFITAVLNQNYKSLTLEAEKVFKTVITPQLVSKAKEYSTTTPQIIKEPPKNELVKKAFEEAFNFFNIEWTIKQSKKPGFNFRLNSKNKILKIGKDINWDYFTLSGLVKHETTHIIRKENGKYNKITTYNYLHTEEGLASYLHDFKGSSTENKINIYRHACEYLAADVAKEGSFRDVYDFFIGKGFSKKTSWQRAARHKYGIKDTSKSGTNMKSAMYFYWENKIKKLSDEQILRLFVGQISIRHLKDYKKYKGRVEENKIKEFYNL